MLSAVPLKSYRCFQYQKCVRLDEHPSLGIAECEVIRWNVSTRFTISMFDPLSDGKASVEITNPYAGTHKEILVQEGLSAQLGASQPRTRLC
ncbi:hypothetical protein BGW80DRAFT_1348765, partial [Lactifluus volemus]